MKTLLVRSDVARECLTSLRKRGVKTLAKGKFKRRCAKAPLFHRQFNTIMLEAARPVLVKSVAAGELDFFECAKIETQINQSIKNPFYQIDQKYLNFLVGKLKANKRLRQGAMV
jgi:hypothetical protein